MGERGEKRAPAVRILETLALAVAALLLPRASLYGTLSPFGVGLAASVSGVGAPIIYAAALAGYIGTMGASSALRYVAAVIAAAGIRWALMGVRELQQRVWLAPLIAGVSVWLSGGITLGLGDNLSVYTILLVLCEGLAAGAFACFCETSLVPLREGGVNSVGQLSALCVTGALLLSAVAKLELGGISPGRIAAALAVLLLARSGREAGGAVAGVVLGSVLALTDPSRLYLCAFYAFGGLMAGLFSRFGRIAASLVFMGSAAIVCLSSGDTISSLIGLYEGAAGSLLFLVLPPRVDRAVYDFFARRQELPAVESFRRSVTLRLDYASKAMREVAGTVDAVSSKLASVSAPDLGSVYRQVSDEVCRNCGLKLFCWENQFENTMDSFNHLTPILKERGEVTLGDVTGHLNRRCGRLSSLLSRINAAYGEHLLRESAWRRLSEIRGVLTDQFSGVGNMLTELSQALSAERRMDAQTAERARAVCESYGMLVSDAVCFLDARRHMTVEILTGDGGMRVPGKTWLQEMGEACGRTFLPPLTQQIGSCLRLILREQPRYRVSMGVAQLSYSGEKLCGDSYEQFTDENGCFAVVLSDGMGSGGRAAVDGAMAAGLTARLMQAGFGDESVLRMVNSALMVKSGDESLATLDVFRVDLHSGKAESLKAGAAASLLLSKKRVSRWEQAALPVGILRDVAFECQKDTLTHGDVVILASDGVYAGGTAWVEEWLKKDNGLTPMARLSEQIAAEARRRQKETEGHEDDITVIALQLHTVV